MSLSIAGGLGAPERREGFHVASLTIGDGWVVQTGEEAHSGPAQNTAPPPPHLNTIS